MTDKKIWESTPDYRYREDVKFRQLVDMFEAYIHNVDFTPSELREAAMLAAVHYEQRRLRRVHGYTMSNDTARKCYDRIEEIYKAIQTDERPFKEPHCTPERHECIGSNCSLDKT